VSAGVPISQWAEDQLLTAGQVAAVVGVNLKRVYELGIPVIRISARSVRWKWRDVLAWINERRELR
jgi:predicted DNA-binding transcriptional regulator AlpA